MIHQWLIVISLINVRSVWNLNGTRIVTSGLFSCMKDIRNITCLFDVRSVVGMDNTRFVISALDVRSIS